MYRTTIIIKVKHFYIRLIYATLGGRISLITIVCIFIGVRNSMRVILHPQLCLVVVTKLGITFGISVWVNS
jgi:hypothetical protein